MVAREHGSELCAEYVGIFEFGGTDPMTPNGRIVIDPDILVGKPVVKGTRLSVDFLLGLLAQGWAEAEILRNYPGLEREDLLACWAYAAEALSQERVYRF